MKIQAENTVCMASLLSLNGHRSSNFDTIHLKLLTYAYFVLLFHSMLSEYENSKNELLSCHHFDTLFINARKNAYKPLYT